MTPWIAARQASLSITNSRSLLTLMSIESVMGRISRKSSLLLLSHFSRVWLCATPSLGFSRQEHWSGLPFPSPMYKSEKWKWSRSVMSDRSRPHGLQPTRLLCPWDFPGKGNGVGCHCLLWGNLLRWGWKFISRSVFLTFFSPSSDWNRGVMAGAPASLLGYEDAGQWTKGDVLDRSHLNPC